MGRRRSRHEAGSQKTVLFTLVMMNGDNAVPDSFAREGDEGLLIVKAFRFLSRESEGLFVVWKALQRNEGDQTKFISKQVSEITQWHMRVQVLKKGENRS